jgi:hypothetical protein
LGVTTGSPLPNLHEIDLLLNYLPLSLPALPTGRTRRHFATCNINRDFPDERRPCRPGPRPDLLNANWPCDSRVRRCCRQHPLPSEPDGRLFDASGSSIGQRLCVARPGTVPPAHDTPSETRLPHWPWGQPGRYCASAGYRRSAGAAPLGVAARDRSALPPEPVGCRFTSADTRGKSARFRAG